MKESLLDKNLTQEEMEKQLQILFLHQKAKLELSENARKVLEKRYLRKNEKGEIIEKPENMFRRVAQNIAHADSFYKPDADIKETEGIFFTMMANLEFLPNSPTLMNAGRELQQLSACFVLPVEDSMEGIFDAVKNAAMIHKSGGGTGFAFSRLRPRNDVVLTTRGVSSGPVSFMEVFNIATETIKQGGTRRGANMGILRVDHPDIMDFIKAKEDNARLNNFNLSVAITDEFMEQLEKNGEYDLLNPRTRRKVGTLNAREVFDTIVKMAWKNGEPGIVFIDKVNDKNPVPLMGEIESTNPCGEQPLMPFESCNLGSINLAKMVKDGSVDSPKLKTTIQNAVHFLDNVIDMNKYPLKKIEDVTKSTRKIGLGIMGFADMLVKLGIPYNSDKAIMKADEVMKFIHEESKTASAELARERGPFPEFKDSVFAEMGYPEMRNATTTTIAPTGTLSIIANCSSGIEPIYALSYTRTVMDKNKLTEVNPLFEESARKAKFFSEELMKKIAENGSIQEMKEIPEEYRDIFVTAHDVDYDWHINMQSAFQKWTDNAVSKTINFKKEATIKNIENAYFLAYKSGCKGLTVYRDGSREGQVLQSGSYKAENTKATELEVAHKVRRPRSRPDVTHGNTLRMRTGCGNLYVTINEDESGPFELFSRMGKSGACTASQSEAISRLISLSLRAGIEPEVLIKQLKGIRCPFPLVQKGGTIFSCSDAIAKSMEKYFNKKVVLEDKSEMAVISGLGLDKCPDCGGQLEFSEGCAKCRCGFSKCG